MSTKTENCSSTSCCNSDVVGKTLSKIGVTRSCLITLALVPFAWKGVVWAASAVEAIWNLATNAVNG